jgi:hypothetical protein
LLLALAPGVYAKKHHTSDPGAPYYIIEANAVSVTVSTGKAGDVDDQQTFKITDSTKVMIDNQPAPAGNLKGGMVAKIDLAEDGVTAVTISAHDPPR